MCSEERSCRIDNIVEQNARFAGDISHDVVHVGLAWTWAVFMEDGERGRERIRELLRSLCTTNVRSDDDRRQQILLAEVLCEDCPCVEGVHGNVEESLDLVAMEIKSDDVICTGFLQELRDKFCGDWFAWFGDAVLACVGEVGEDDMNGGSKAEFCCLAEEEEFHDVFIRCTTSCLEEVDSVSSDRFLKANVPFSATEYSACNFSQGDTEFTCEMFGQTLV